jgi:hypothetical protein
LQKLKIPEIGKISQTAATCLPIEKIDASCALKPCAHSPETTEQNITQAANQVADWYDAFVVDHPTLAAELHPADADELAACHATGTLNFITLNGTNIGLIATEPGPIDWLHGHIVIEEILAPTHRGHGYAAQAQRLLAAQLSNSNGPETPITGTIHRLNIASHRAATTAGRPALLDYRFLSLNERAAHAPRDKRNSNSSL